MWDPSEDEWYCPREDVDLTLILPNECDELCLTELLDIALSNNLDIRAAWLRARAQAYELSASKNSYYPKISGTFGWEWNDRQHGPAPKSKSNSPRIPVEANLQALDNISFTPAEEIIDEEEFDEDEFQDECDCEAPVFIAPPRPGAPARAGVWNATLSLSYMLLDFGGRQAGVEAARQALDSLNWSQNRKIQDIMFAVIQSYYQALTTIELLKAKEQELVKTKSNLEMAHTLNAAGLSTYLDVLQMSTQMAQTNLAIANLTAQAKNQLATLVTALGLPPNTPIKLRPLPGQLPVDTITAGVDELMEFAQLNRPDLAASYAKVIQAQMDTIIATSQGLPTIKSDARFQQGKKSTNAGSNSLAYRGAITMDLPIFNGFMNVNKVLKSKESAYAAQAVFDRLMQTVGLDVVTSYNAFVASKEGLVSAEAFYNQAKEAYFYASQLYQGGTGTMMNLMTTQATFAEAEAKRIQAKTQWAIALFKVSYMSGMLNPSDIHDGCATAPDCEINEELTNESMYVE